MESINLRQENLLDLPEGVAVVGCGGVGSWCAYFLALAGVKKLFLFDGDEISEHNLNRIPLPMAAVGVRKSKAIAKLIKALRPQCEVLALGAFTTSLAKTLRLQSEVSFILATTDTLSSRRMTYKWASDFSIPYIEAAAEGEMGTATGVPADWSTPEEAQPGYASVPVWVGPCVVSAVIAVGHIVHNEGMWDRTIRMGWGGESYEICDSHKKEKKDA